MRKEVAEMTVDERRVSIDTEDEESSSISPIKSSIHIKENSPFIYPSSAITEVSYLNNCNFPSKIFFYFYFSRLMSWKEMYLVI